MGIHAIVGNPKKGKSLFMAGLWQNAEYEEYYSNITLKGHDYKILKSIDDIYDIPQNNRTKGIFVDELQQMGADSWDYGVLSSIVGKLGSQHRKYHADFFFTTQELTQIINRIRNIRDTIMKPLRIMFNECGKPQYVNIMLLDTDIYGHVYEKNRFWFPLFKEKNGKIEYACDLYDTYQFVEQMEPYQVTMSRKLKEKYKDFNLWGFTKMGEPKEIGSQKRFLKSKMVLEDNISKTLANDIVNMISQSQLLKIKECGE